MQIKLLQQAIQRARKDASEADEEAEPEANKALDELKTAQMILRGHGPGGDLRKLLKQKQPSLLAWLLGPRVNVISIRVMLPVVMFSKRMFRIFAGPEGLTCTFTGDLLGFPC